MEIWSPLIGGYDEEQDLFRSVSKVGTGFTDEHLENFTIVLKAFELHKSPRVEHKDGSDGRMV